MEPESPKDAKFAEEAREWAALWFIHPLFKGDYPPAMRETADKKSKDEGRTTSRLPYFTDYERQMLIGSADFLGINYYITLTVRAFRPEERGKHLGLNYDFEGTGWLNSKDMP
ncbi:unnamed protein product [Cylicostephanus goldi]|uniref:Uncharacterized protein n=1 Tax=Cylicostephanus goldi TaxID=71465 RepID=A0A3P7M030_CYLGO|nr:unnamed protein product [Cylicostephanus goldi]